MEANASSKINFVEVYSYLNDKSHLVCNIYVCMYVYSYFSYYWILDDYTNLKFGILYGKETFYKPSSRLLRRKSQNITRVWRIACHMSQVGSLTYVSFSAS